MGRVKAVIPGERVLAKTCMGKMVELYIMFLWGRSVHGQENISLEKEHRVVVEFDAMLMLFKLIL